MVANAANYGCVREPLPPEELLSRMANEWLLDGMCIVLIWLWLRYVNHDTGALTRRLRLEMFEMPHSVQTIPLFSSKEETSV